MGDACRWPLPHRDRHNCACICVLPPGHKGHHKCEVTAPPTEALETIAHGRDAIGPSVNVRAIMLYARAALAVPEGDEK